MRNEVHGSWWVRCSLWWSMSLTQWASGAGRSSGWNIHIYVAHRVPPSPRLYSQQYHRQDRQRVHYCSDITRVNHPLLPRFSPPSTPIWQPRASRQTRRGPTQGAIGLRNAGVLWGYDANQARARCASRARARSSTLLLDPLAQTSVNIHHLVNRLYDTRRESKALYFYYQNSTRTRL